MKRRERDLQKPIYIGDGQLTRRDCKMRRFGWWVVFWGGRKLAKTDWVSGGGLVMSLGVFLLETVLISLSGVMAPGPMTAITVGKGMRSRFAGAFISLGHAIVEIPLIVFLLFGLGEIMAIPKVKSAIAIAGGIFLLYMSFSMLMRGKKGGVDPKEDGRQPILIGLAASAGNPYFLIWWATVGMALIVRAELFGPLGFTLFALVHWLCDFVWLSFLSLAAYKGGQVWGARFQRAVTVLSGLVLAIFGIRFIFGVF